MRRSSESAQLKRNWNTEGSHYVLLKRPNEKEISHGRCRGKIADDYWIIGRWLHLIG